MQSQEEVFEEMTDLQFYAMERDKREAELRQEIERLRGNKTVCSGEGMTDLQFMSYKEERDKREALEKAELLRELAALREENAALKRS
jgi:hypothetical protein